MRNYILAALAGVVLSACACAGTARAAIHSGFVGPSDGTQVLTFGGSAGGATGSATMAITVTYDCSLTIVVAQVWNNSPITYLDGNSQRQTNRAAVTGFGFDVSPNVAFSSYSIVAQQWNGTALTDVLLGDTNPTGNVWNLEPNGGSGAIQVDMFANNGGGIDSALYNPLIAGDAAIGDTNPFFTGATLTMVFDRPDVIVDLGYSDEAGIEGDGSYVTPFLRMKRVGAEGSLKLEMDTPPETALLGPPLPEPSSLAVWMLAAGGATLLLRHRKRATQ